MAAGTKLAGTIAEPASNASEHTMISEAATAAASIVERRGACSGRRRASSSSTSAIGPSTTLPTAFDRYHCAQKLQKRPAGPALRAGTKAPTSADTAGLATVATAR